MNILLSILISMMMSGAKSGHKEIVHTEWTQEQVITCLNNNIDDYIYEKHENGYYVSYMRTDCVVSPDSDVSFNLRIYTPDESQEFKVWMTYHFKNGICTNFEDAFAGSQGNINMNWVEDEVINLVH